MDKKTEISYREQCRIFSNHYNESDVEHHEIPVIVFERKVSDKEMQNGCDRKFLQFDEKNAKIMLFDTKTQSYYSCQYIPCSYCSHMISANYFSKSRSLIPHCGCQQNYDEDQF